LTVDEQDMSLSIYDNIFIIDRIKIDAIVEKKLKFYYIARDLYFFFSRFGDSDFQLDFLSFIIITLFVLIF
jgi:hypothetical protein